MKKISISIIIMFLMVLSTMVLGYTEKFTYMLDTMGISQISSNGYQINEEIYNQYNQLVYGDPLSAHEGQRWKDVSDGKWSKNAGEWKGVGIRGEYWILGFDINGELIHNHKFPVDIEPPTSPVEWRYVILPDAESSWYDTKKYLHEEQKKHMQTQNLMRNDVTYEITALDIGLNKTKAENYATWRTAGNIYTRRYDINNKEWAANFIVPPMAANAELVAKLSLPYGNEYIIQKEESKVEIPITFGCEVINLNNYAKESHIREIKSTLKIDEVTKNVIKNEKTKFIEDQCILVIDRNDYENQNEVILKIKNESLLFTEFTVDGALTDVISTEIIIYFDENKIKNDTEIIVKDDNKINNPELLPPQIDGIVLKRLSVNNNLVNLNIAKKTNSQFICAGQILVIKISTSNNVKEITMEIQGNSSINTLDSLTKRFEWDEPRERKERIKYKSIRELENQYIFPKIIIPDTKTENGIATFSNQYLIPYGTKQTLHSWNTLRDISKDTFNIDENRLFERILSPYVIKIKAYSDNGVITKSINLDVFERWDTLYNRDISRYIK